MTNHLIQVQYCDNIIRHQNNGQYSLIGIYGNEYPITSETSIIPQLGLNIVLSPELETQVSVARTQLHIAVSNNVLVQFDLPPKPHHTPQKDFFMIIQPILNNIVVQRGDQLHVSMIKNQQVIARSPVLHII